MSGFPQGITVTVPEPELVIEKRLPLMEAGDKDPESVINIIHETLEGTWLSCLFCSHCRNGFSDCKFGERF